MKEKETMLLVELRFAEYEFPYQKMLLLGHVLSECSSLSLARKVFSDVLEDIVPTGIILVILEQACLSNLFEY